MSRGTRTTRIAYDAARDHRAASSATHATAPARGEDAHDRRERLTALREAAGR